MTVHHRALRKAVMLTRTVHVHQMLGVIILIAHASEIGRVVSEIGLWHLFAATTLFGLWLATERGEKKELTKTELA